MSLHRTILLLTAITAYLCNAKYGLVLPIPLSDSDTSKLSDTLSKLSDSDTYLVGMGRFDITGPIAEVNMMGYAMLNQIAHGLHLRQYSRAYVISSSDSATRLTFVSIDACMGTQIVKLLVLEKLAKLYPNNQYTEANLMISAIHTHSGPAGFFQYLLFELTSLGYVNQTTFAIVDGIVQSIVLAHQNIRSTKIYINSGVLHGANINRSPSAYLLNPQEERNLYPDGNTDKLMVMLKFVDASTGVGRGLITWHAVHCTSMNNTNELVSSDNKGYASLLAEQHFNKGALPGRGEFVAAFAQSNLGDVSPNTNGPRCYGNGDSCDILTSTCGGKNEKCYAFGPGKDGDMFESTKIIAEKQYNISMQLWDASSTQITGPLWHVGQTIDMSNQTVTLPDGSTAHTCKPAMGYSFAAGTIDGPGAFDFTQADNNKTNILWNTVRNLIKKPSQEQVDCQHPKPILLDTGEITNPYPWQASIVDTQLFRIGQLVVAAVPGEFTTMSGRRTRKAIRDVLIANGMTNSTQVVIAGLSNVYSDYITTYEEYQQQRYEGASTIHGPHTLRAYIQQYEKLAKALATGQKMPTGPKTPNYRSKQITMLPGVLYDGGKPGKVKQEPMDAYSLGDTVVVIFESGHPRNNLMTNRTFLEVQLKLQNEDKWSVVATDANWETRFYWKRGNIFYEILGESTARIEWSIPLNAVQGSYKIVHYGSRKEVTGKILEFSGESNVFSVK